MNYCKKSKMKSFICAKLDKLISIVTIALFHNAHVE